MPEIAALAEAQARLTWLAELATRAIDKQERCPYQAATGSCTALFGCRNQRRHGPAVDCAAAPGELDWRDAWDS